ncbi:angiopoietin-related protein 4 [Rhinophrynus dorsalis]
MMKLLLAILILCASVLGGESWGIFSEKKTPQFASWDEVNVIAHGLLQLGHGLKEHVDKTKGQLQEITGKLNKHNASLVDLIRQTIEVRQSGEVLKVRVQELEDRDRQLSDLSQGLKEKVQEVSNDKELLDQRLQNVEAKLQQLDPGRRQNRSDKQDIQSIESLMEIQNKRIDELLERIKQQQYKLDKQNIQIKSLQGTIQNNRIESQKLRLNLKKNVKAESQSNSSAETEKDELPSDCHQIFLEGERSSGIFTIQPLKAQPFKVFCEITEDGGWTVIQRRKDGSVDFDQLWDSYKNGFGNLDGEFWLGLEKMHQITEQGQYIMHIELNDWDKNVQYMEAKVHLGGPNTAYALQLLGPVTGELENALGDFGQLPFSTRDRDQDLKSDFNCAKHLSGGWWFSTCGHSNLNGKYFLSVPRPRHERKQGIFWKTWKGRYYPLKSTSIKIRPVELESV